MFDSSFRYFFKFLFFGKNKQRLLFLAAFGLFISSFALIILQSVMGGLQENLISRSQKVLGSKILFLGDFPFKDKSLIYKKFLDKGFSPHKEWEIEILIKNKGYLSPVVIHGVDPNNLPVFLEGKDFNGLVLGSDLSFKLKTGYEDKVQVISPAHFDPLLGNIPRTSSEEVLDIITTDVPEIDLFHGWVRLSFLYNLTKKKDFNRIRFNSLSNEKSREFDLIVNEILEKYPNASLKSWFDLHPTLTKALNLETSVMVFLFLSMTFLVSIAITCGVLIFMEKVNKDMISLWILGTAPGKLKSSAKKFFLFLNFFCVLCGLSFGLLFLVILDIYGGNLMPDVFVDRQIPVNITLKGVLVSFFGPLLVSSFFSLSAFAQFKTNSKIFLEKIRTAG